MTAKPIKSTTRYINGREREIFRNAIMDGETFICEVSSPYRKTLNLITQATLKALEDDEQRKVPTGA